MSDWTPLPGIQLPETTADNVIRQFKEKFYRPSSNKPQPGRIWLAFPENMPSQRSDDSILSSPAFLGYRTVLFWIEGTNEVYQATPRQVAEHFAARNPWEDFDTYIFNESMEWCIVFTHNLMHGVAVIQVGNMA